MVGKVLREDQNGLVTLTLNRPEKLNSLTIELFCDLLAQIEVLETETKTVGCVLLKGAGRCFSAGHDLGDLAKGVKPPRPGFQGHVVRRLASLPQPVISAVHGHCYTGALELALAGDVILASQNARFADTHAKWSVTPVWGMSQRLPRRIGAAKAQEMMFTCRPYDGTEAAVMGLANYCFPDESFEADVASLVATILANSWFTHRANKRLILATDGLPLSAGLAHEACYGEGAGPDMHERIARFLHKDS